MSATDVSDRTAMFALKERILQEFGPIDGVLHCAGTTGTAAHREVAVLGTEEAAWHFGPKLYGTQVLHDVLADQRLDFAIICSSIASLLGGLGFGAYAAANAALDAFAQRHHSADRPWTSVNWEAWYFSHQERADSDLGAAVRELALTPAEGRQVFDALLDAVPQTQIITSTGDLMLRQELWSDPSAEPTAPPHGTSAPTCATRSSPRTEIPNTRWRRSGRSCSAWKASALRTTSSNWAEAHCSAFRSSTDCVRN